MNKWIKLRRSCRNRELLSRRYQWAKKNFKAVSGMSAGEQFVCISERLDGSPQHDNRVVRSHLISTIAVVR